jgi:hypothetical protein
MQKSEDGIKENEVLTASSENSESSPINESKVNAKLAEGESSLDMLNFSINHAMIEQTLVEPSFVLPLSQDDLLDLSCDKDDSHDNTYAISMQLLMSDHAICVLESNTCAENRHVIHNASDVDELKLMSSLNTDVLCNLKYLEKLYTYADLPWFARLYIMFLVIITTKDTI